MNFPTSKFLTAFITIFSAFSFQANAQINYSITEAKQGLDLEHWKKAISDQGDFFYSFSGKGVIPTGKVTIQKYDKNLDLVLEVEHKLNSSSGNLKYEDAFVSDDKIYVLTTSGGVPQQVEVYCFIFDTNSLSLINEKRIGDYTYKRGPGAGATPKNAFITKSADGQKILIGYKNLLIQEVMDEFKIHVLDRDLNLISSRTVENPTSDKLPEKISTRKYLFLNGGSTSVDQIPKIANDGTVFLNCVLPLKSPTFQLSPDSEEWEEYPVKFDNKLLESYQMELLDEEKELVFSGTYIDGDSRLRGAFRMAINRMTKAILDSTFSAPTLDLNEGHEDSKKGKDSSGEDDKPKWVYGFMDWGGIKYHKEGGGIFWGERAIPSTYSIATKTRNPASNSTSSYEMKEYYDIVVVGFDAENNFQWITKIPKKQLPPYQGIVSYQSFIGDNGIYFLYIDHKANLESPDPKNIKEFNRNNGINVIARVDFEGNLVREPLKTDDDLSRHLLFPERSVSSNDNEVKLFMWAKKDERLLKVALGE